VTPERTSINLVVIRAREPGRLAEFYSRLGLEFLVHRHGRGPEHFSAVVGDVVFEIYPAAGMQGSADAVRLGFRVARLNAVVAKLASAGARILSAPAMSEWGPRAVVEDPEGIRVELTESSGQPLGDRTG